MRIIYDEETIANMMFYLSSVTGLSFSFVDCTESFRTVSRRDKAEDEFCHKINATAIGSERCKCSDRELIERCRRENRAVSHLCHAGVLDTAVPVKKDGITVGTILIGRVRTDESIDDIIRRVSWLDASKEEIKRRYEKLSYFPKDRLESLINLISNLIFDSAIRIEQDNITDMAVEYIKNNLDGHLSVDVLCQKLFISKNKLYREFHNAFNTTVNDYISNKRIEKAKELLRNSDKTSREIAENVGIPNYTYFHKLFKRLVGTTPNVYRRSSMQ